MLFLRHHCLESPTEQPTRQRCAGRPSKACIISWKAEATHHKFKTLWTDLRPGELEKAVVYGSYTAVQYADAVMLQRLAESIPHLMCGVSKQAV